jgi:microcystin-dependent protein
MATPFLGEIRLISFNFPPKGWAFCNGQLLSIQQNTALFALLGTTYGGNGQTTFQLPNLQGRVPLHLGADGFGNNYVMGQQGGEATHTLSLAELPAHVHALQASNLAASMNSPFGAAPAQPAGAVGAIYGSATAITTMAPQAIGNTGGNQPHTNEQPYLVINFCIALVGIFPSRN